MRAFVAVANPGGGYSSTELPSFNLEVGCRQVINPTLDLQLTLDSLPECTASPALPVSGRLHSRGNVERIFYTVNGGAQIEVCANCGADPAFNFVATLAACENQVTITALDEFADQASATGFVRHDATPPGLTGCEDLSVKVSSDATGATVNFAVTATDNCHPAVQVICDPPSGSFFPVGETTVTCIATDKCGNVAQCEFQVRVTANDPPVARCRNVTVFAGATCFAEADINDGSFDPDPDDRLTIIQAPPGPYPLGETLVTLTVTDNHGASSQCTAIVTVLNPDPVVTLTGPANGSIFPINTPVNCIATFTDAGSGTHAGTWMFDDLSQAASIAEPLGATPGSASATHSFTRPGVYSVKLTITDPCGGSATADQMNGLEVLVIIYDPDGGFVTGGGWINSPAGAFTANPSLTGKANFGFVAKYQNGANMPTGNTEFQFKAGNLNFHSTSYEWLVVAGAKAKYKGSGRINGAGDYGFMLTAIDGEVSGGGGTDKFRIKIWDNSAGGVIYDNQLNAPDTDDPTTVLQGGSVVIHRE